MTDLSAKLDARPATFTCDKSKVGPLYYFAITDRAPGPYKTQRHVEAILDIASDGTLAGVELIDNMPPPPARAQSIRTTEAMVPKVKPLEWHGDNGHGAGFKYVIAEPSRTLGWRVWANLTDLGPNGMANSIGGHIVTMKAENREAAIAAAQADFAARILSALEPS